MSETEPPPEVQMPMERDRVARLVNKAYGTAADIEQVTCEIIGVGQGFMSDITKANITWTKDSEKLPDFLVFKVPTMKKIKQIPTLAKMITEEVVTMAHNSEVAAYKYFSMFPPTPFPMAKCIHAEERGKQGAGLLVLAGVHGRSTTFNETFSVAKARTLLDHLSSIHAYAEKHDHAEVIHSEAPQDFLSGMMEGAREKAAGNRERHPKFTLTEDDIDRLLEATGDATKIMNKPKDYGYKTTVNLGDLQPNNILWKVNPDGSLSDEVAAMIDFQGCHESSFVDDVCAVLNWGMSHKDDAVHGEELLRYYHAELTRKCGGKAPVELSEILELRKKFLPPFVIITSNLLGDLDQMKDAVGIKEETIEDMVEKILYMFKKTGV